MILTAQICFKGKEYSHLKECMCMERFYIRFVNGRVVYPVDHNGTEILIEKEKFQSCRIK